MSGRGAGRAYRCVTAKVVTLAMAVLTAYRAVLRGDMDVNCFMGFADDGVVYFSVHFKEGLCVIRGTKVYPHGSGGFG